MTAGRVLLRICAIGALLSAVVSLAGLSGVTDDALLAEAWRGYGFLVFAGLFELLARRPDLTAVWLLVAAHKAAMSVTATALVASDSGSTDAGVVAVADGVVTLLLVAAFLILRRDRAPSPAPEEVPAWSR